MPHSLNQDKTVKLIGHYPLPHGFEYGKEYTVKRVTNALACLEVINRRRAIWKRTKLMMTLVFVLTIILLFLTVV